MFDVMVSVILGLCSDFKNSVLRGPSARVLLSFVVVTIGEKFLAGNARIIVCLLETVEKHSGNVLEMIMCVGSLLICGLKLKDESGLFRSLTWV